MRRLILITLVLAAAAAILWLRSEPGVATISPPLDEVASAHQLGVVGYRDPAGAISPDGQRFAYTEGRFIRVVSIGAAPLTLAPGEGQIRYLTWSSATQIVAEDPTPAARWWTYQLGAADRQPLWSGMPIDTAGLRQLTWSRDGRWAAGIVTTNDGPELWRIASDTTSVERTKLGGRVSYPAFMPDGVIACVIDAQLTIPCGGAPRPFEDTAEVYGPIAFSPTGDSVYFASPTGRGMIHLRAGSLRDRTTLQIGAFERDAYAPSVAADGTTVFKVQNYMTTLADVPATGGPTRLLTNFQSETPSYHPTRPLLAFTYGTWRRVLDDAKYPDIAQEIGVIDVGGNVPATAPSEVIAKSDSEDQAMAWSPNGKWIAFHTHREMSDDVWLRPVDGSRPDKRITFLGRGAEVGWPRWSPDGMTVLLDGARQSDGRSVIYAIGVDQDTGNLRSDLREVRAESFDGDITHAEWLGNESVIAVGKEGPGRHAIFTLPIGGGVPKIVHRFATEHDFPGLAVSPDGRFVAFVGPATSGYYQIFTKAIAGDTAPVQITTDRSHKTQPAWSPDGQRIAFTIWSYDAMFYSFSAQ